MKKPILVEQCIFFGENKIMSGWKYKRKELYRKLEGLIEEIDPKLPYYKKLQEKFQEFKKEILERK